MFTRRKFFKSLSLAGLLPLKPVSQIKVSTSEKIVLRFAVASDGHYGQEGTPFQMYYDHIVRWLNLEKKERGLDLAFFNGDLIHDDPAFLPLVEEKLQDLDMPYYTIRGNHDRVDQATWQKVWGYATNHAFQFQQTGFILADTSNEEGKYLCADVGWMEKQLQSFRNAERIFVMLHISQLDWTTHGVSCPAVMDLLASHSLVKAVFHGHDHQEDDVKYYKGKPFFYSGHFGGSWGVEYKGFKIVEVLNNGSIQVYQNNPTANAKLYPLQLA
jgi:3',5'-cyclic AMP phosphodiesterase CpdA